jgi:hypothetical protein
MGRPLNKKYFGNRNTNGVGGEGLASVTAPAGTLGSLVNGTYTIPAADISAPQITGGVKPTLRVVVTGATAYTVVVITAGTGYTSAPTITFTGSVAGGSGSATPIATLTTTIGDAIVCQGITSGSTNRTSGNDIIKQVGSRRYRIQTQDGTAVCTLKASAPTAAGEMAIVATDSASGTYYVTKLTGRKATLKRGTGTIYADGATVGWTFGTATATVCKIPSA